MTDYFMKKYKRLTFREEDEKKKGWDLSWLRDIPEDLKKYKKDEKERNERKASFLNKLKSIFSSFPHYGVPHEPTEIANGVYLGTTCDAENSELLYRLNITHVINCAAYKKILPRERRQRGESGTPHVIFYEIRAEDDEEYDMMHHFQTTNNYIKRVRMSGGKVLVCDTGASRAATICMGYLLGVKSMFLLQAAKHLKDCRRVAICNDNFMEQLIDYAEECEVLDTAPRIIKTPTYGSRLDRNRLFAIGMPEVQLCTDYAKYKYDRYMY